MSIKWFLSKTGKEHKGMDVMEKIIIPDRCKTCRKNARRQTSSYCQECADSYKQSQTL